MPRAVKGQRFGGRKKGTPNKSTALFTTVKAALDREGVNPAEFIAGYAYKPLPEDNPELRFRACAELLKYIAPQMLRSEVTGADGGPIQHGPVQLIIEYADELPGEAPEASSESGASSEGSEEI